MLQFMIDTAVNLHLEGKCSTELASLAKYRATQGSFDISNKCLQLFGGYGYLRNSPVGRAFVDSRVTMIYGGANEVMKEIIARKFGFIRAQANSRSFAGGAVDSNQKLSEKNMEVLKPSPIASKI